MTGRKQQHETIYLSLPLMIVGLFIVVYALLETAWPPDYKNAIWTDTSTHFERLTGADAPENIQVEREDGYAIRRTLDALIYYMVLQGIAAVIGLAWFGERSLYLLLIISGLYGILYAANLGIVIGPILTAGGFSLVLWGGVLGWLTTRPHLRRMEITNGTHFTT